MGHLDVAESVRLVQVGDGLLVAAHEVLAVSPVGELQERGRLQEHALADGFCAEVAVAGDLDLHQLVALPAVDQEVDGGLVVDDGLFLELHFGFEIALRLEKVA